MLDIHDDSNRLFWGCVIANTYPKSGCPWTFMDSNLVGGSNSCCINTVYSQTSDASEGLETEAAYNTNYV
jgi:hypothetical protein